MDRDNLLSLSICILGVIILLFCLFIIRDSITGSAIESLPDLVVDSLSPIPESISISDKIWSPQIVVKNIGSGASPIAAYKSEICWYSADNSAVAEGCHYAYESSSLAPLNSIAVMFGYVSIGFQKTGRYEIRARINTDGVINELHEENNVASVFIQVTSEEKPLSPSGSNTGTVPSPDLIVESISWSPKTTWVGQPTMFTIGIKNAGIQITPDSDKPIIVNLCWYDSSGAEEGCAKSVPSLANLGPSWPNIFVSISYGVQFQKPGGYKLIAKIDPDNYFVEFRENNNEFSKSLTVSSPPQREVKREAVAEEPMEKEDKKDTLDKKEEISEDKKEESETASSEAHPSDFSKKLDTTEESSSPDIPESESTSPSSESESVQPEETAETTTASDILIRILFGFMNFG